MGSRSARTLKSVERTLEILQLLKQSGGSSVSALADELDVSPGTVHAYLATLRKDGYLVQEDAQYRLGPSFIPLGEHVRHRSPLYQAAREQVESLAENTGECAHLIIEHDGRIFTLYEAFGERAVGVEHHARKEELSLNHLHCTAAGKAILSKLPRERVTEIFEKWGMPAVTKHTITQPDPLFEELDQVRERNYSTADEEQIRGIRAVGAPITYPDGQVAGALAVSGPKSRLRGDIFENALPDRIMQAANVCEVTLQSKLQSSLESDN